MSSIVISGDTSGAITLAAPAVAGTNTATLPAATGTVMVSGNMPAFSAYQSSAQTLSNATTTKITFTTEVFDTNNNFASSTFTPTVAGYYQVNCGITVSTATVIILFFFKNGSAFYRIANTNSSPASTVSGSNLIYLNGSTDYVEVYAYAVIGSALGASQLDTYFSGSMVRAA